MASQISSNGPRCATCKAVCELHIERDGTCFCSWRCLWAFWDSIDDYIKAAQVDRHDFEKQSVLRWRGGPVPGSAGVYDDWIQPGYPWK